MSRNKLAILLLTAGCSAAAAAPVRCPANMTDAAGRHVLENASLYDGPPANMTDLIPLEYGAVARWDLNTIDPYLVCYYAGTAAVMTFHPVGAKLCEARRKPFRAYCWP